jgi:hypothetical protein
LEEGYEMISALEEKLWAAGSGQTNDEAAWREIIDSLLAEFRDLLSADFEIDPDLKIDPARSQFHVWIWSKPAPIAPLSVTWSALLAGSPVGDADSNDSFVVTVDLFLFHEAGKRRLYTYDGLHFLQFVFDRQTAEQGGWRSLGWQKDEWGEWENLGSLD